MFTLSVLSPLLINKLNNIYENIFILKSLKFLCSFKSLTIQMCKDPLCLSYPTLFVLSYPTLFVLSYPTLNPLQSVKNNLLKKKAPTSISYTC